MPPFFVDAPIQTSLATLATDDDPLETFLRDAPELDTDIFGQMGGMQGLGQEAIDSVRTAHVVVEFMLFL
jgi:hypothetical protein